MINNGPVYTKVKKAGLCPVYTRFKKVHIDSDHTRVKKVDIDLVQNWTISREHKKYAETIPFAVQNRNLHKKIHGGK